MKGLILAAGYATRLYPLTENFPKPLLPVAGRPILDHLLEDIDNAEAVDAFFLVSNHKYYRHFCEWAADKKQKITVLDDGSETNETRLGAVRDMLFAMEKGNIAEDILVIAGDNLLDFSLTKFIRYAEEKKTSCIMRYAEKDREKRKKSAVVTVDATDLVLRMEEKPREPESIWCCPPFYIYRQADAARIREGILDGCKTDAPGSFAAWLAARAPVHAMEMPGHRFDIGDMKSYMAIKNGLR